MVGAAHLFKAIVEMLKEAPVWGALDGASVAVGSGFAVSSMNLRSEVYDLRLEIEGGLRECEQKRWRQIFPQLALYLHAFTTAGSHRLEFEMRILTTSIKSATCVRQKSIARNQSRCVLSHGSHRSLIDE